MILEGNAHILGDNINSDQIISGKHLSKITGINEIDKLTPYLFEDIKQDFNKVIKDDFIVAGNNFGAGFSKEHAPLLVKTSGARGIIAKSFARNFYRNGMNIGLPLIEVEWKDIKEGDLIRINLQEGYLINLSNEDKKTLVKPIPDIMINILKEGGLINYYNNHSGLVEE